MLDLFSTYRPISNVDGQTVTTNHWGRSTANLPFLRADSAKGGFNIASEYYAGGGGNNFLVKFFHPYYDEQKAADPDWSVQTDPNAPRPSSGQAYNVVAKYEQLSGLTHNGLLNADDLLVGGVMAELHPYWERMLVHSTVMEIANSTERADIDSNYLWNGISTVEDILEKDQYNEAVSVQFAFAQSNAFLQLTEAEKAGYASMSLADQWELIYIAAEDRSAYIAAADKPHAGNAQTSFSSYKSSIIGLEADKKAMDLDAVLARFEAHRAETGVDFKVEFEETFQLLTQQMDFSSIASQLKGVYQLYAGILGRTPEQTGFEYWLKEINAGYTLEELAEGFVNSVEFQGQVGTAGTQVTFDQTLTALYQVVLGRDPDQTGYDWWKDKYENESYTLGNVASGFTWSEEFEAKVDQHSHAWLAATYGPNLHQLDLEGLLFSQEDIEAIVPVGSYDIYADDGYAGIIL